MDHKNEVFTPDDIDEQVEALLPVQQSHTSRVRVVQQLQDLCSLGEDGQNSLEHVWKQLDAHRISIQSHNNQNDNWTEQIRPDIGSQKVKGTPRLALLVAVVILSFLIGSSVVVLNTVHQARVSSTLQPATQHTLDQAGLYTTMFDGLYRLDLKSGKQIWHYPTQQCPSCDNSRIKTTATVVNGVAYGSDGFYVYAVNTSNGSLRWHFKLTSDTPYITGGTVYVRGVDSNVRKEQSLYALDASTGALRWSRDFPVRGFIEIGVVTQNTIYATLYINDDGEKVHGTLNALSAKDGSTLWTTKLTANEEQQHTFSIPRMLDNVLYLSSRSSSTGVTDWSYLYAYNPENGALLWHSTKLNGLAYWPPMIGHGKVYIIAEKRIYALNTRDGSELWSYAAESELIDFHVANNGNVLLLISTKKDKSSIIELGNNNGSVLWLQKIQDDFNGKDCLAVNGDFAYAASSTKVIYVMGMSDGSLTKSFRISSNSSSVPDSPFLVAVP